MNDQEPSEQQKHWRELAEQLGLPGDAEDSRAPVSAPPPRSASEKLSKGPPDAAIVSHGRTEGETRDQGQLARPGSGTTTPAAEIDPGEARKIGSSAREERRPQERKPASVSRREGGRSQDRERPGRGRREPARDSSAGEGAPAEVAPDTGEVSERGTGEKKRPGRGRGRSNVANPDPRTRGPLPDEPRSPATSTTETDEKDEVDNLTDWNVPSWTELIESLYRPER
jgi:hypothetical protein